MHRTNRATTKLYRLKPKPFHGDSRKRWRLAPIDPKRALKPAEVRAQDQKRRAES